MKKTIKYIILIMTIILPFNVNAGDYKIMLSYFSNGGKISSGNVEIISGVVFVKNSTKADATYSSAQTINHINSLDGTNTFTLKKGNTPQTKTKEWYAINYINGKKVYFDNSKKYAVKDIIKKLNIDTSYYESSENAIDIYLQANFEKVVKVTNIKLNSNSIKIKKGKTSTLTTTISPSNATDKTVIWSSENTAIAKVDSNGNITAIKEGTTNIVAKTNDGAKIAKCKITVAKAAEEPATIKITSYPTKMKTGETYTLKATVTPKEQEKIKWSSNDTKIASIDQNGKIKALKEGTVKITAQSGSKLKTTITINIEDNEKTEWGITEKDIKDIESGKKKISYELFGAKANDTENDFSAIWRAHQFANYEYIEKGKYLTVYACEAEDCSNKKYYIREQKCPMSKYCSGNTPILVGTNTNLGNATIILDDGAIGDDATQYTYKIISSINQHKSIKKDGTGLIYLNNDMIKSFSKTNSINPNTKNLKSIIDAVNSNKIVTENNGSKKVSTAQKNRLTSANKWGIAIVNNNRIFNRKGVNQGDCYQTEDLIIDSKTGDVLTPIDWKNEEINTIAIYPIDNIKKIFENGKFITYTNNKVYPSSTKSPFKKRGIFVQYSGNVEIRRIYHSLDETKYKYNSSYQDNPIGNRYYGFINLAHASQVKLQNLQLVPHSRVKIYGTKSNYEGTYDLILEYSNNISLNAVTHNCNGDNNCYGERMLNEKKWGIMGMNSVKNVWFNNCALNRIDAHRGVTNLYVENTSIGIHGFTLTGQGNFYAKNIKLDRSPRILTLRRDYGASWNGTMVFNGVNFVVKDGINQAAFVNAINEQDWDFKYKSYFPNIFMDNVTIDTKTKKAIANRINILELANVKKLDKSNENNLYYFKGIVSITNLKYNNYTTQPNVYLFTDEFNSDPNNYLFSRYGGNQVAIYKDKSINYNSNFSSSRNTKFKNANTTSINGRINEMEKFFTSLKNKAGI